MQQKIEENRRENFENDTCIPSIALGAASYFFIKQGKAQCVGVDSEDGSRGIDGNIHRGSICSYIQRSSGIYERHLCFYMKTEKKDSVSIDP